MADTTAPTTPEQSFLSELVEHGDKLVAADLPSDVRKVLGALVNWVGSGGKFVDPDVFNPAAEQALNEEQAESARLANRIAQLEAQLAAQASPTSAVESPAVPPAAPAVPPAAPAAPAVPVVQAPADAAPAETAPVPPTPPASA